MKKFVIDQKFLSFKSKFAVRDESENTLYTVEGKDIFCRKNVLIFDANNEEVARISERIGRTYTYELLTKDGDSAIIKAVMKLKNPSYEVECKDIELIPDKLVLNYDIVERGVKIGRISTKFMTMASRAEIEIYEERCELLVLSLGLAVIFTNANLITTGTMAGAIGGAAGFR